MIAFCTTCKGRVQHIERTLPANLRDNPGPNSKFVVVDYNSPDHLLGYLAASDRKELESGKLVVYSYRNGDGPFRMAHAKNMAHRCGMLEGADILVNLDADNFTGPGFEDYIVEQFKEADVYLWAKMIKDGQGRLPKGISGRIAVSKHAFLNVGGYDEKYDTWGPDDKDFTARLRRLGYEPWKIDPVFLDAIMHNDKMRFKEYRHVQVNNYEDEFELLEGAETTIANFGNFGCGTVYRNFDFDNPIELEPLPTRIFGIGMHKTATTSLSAALRLLGFDSAHWTSAHWAKRVWRELSASGRSDAIERHYAMSDLPFTFLFRELDRAYPGSKFILTTRDEGKWIDSVRRHWSAEFNPYRAHWDEDPFTHKAHKLLYGQKGFNEELFLNRFRRHNAEVLAYFKYRPSDLLVMDMETAGWPELCGFLNRPAPAVPYPRHFRTERDILAGEETTMAKTQWQRQQAKLMAAKHPHPPTPPTPAPAAGTPTWLKDLIAVLEAILGVIPAIGALESNQRAVVVEKLARLKEGLPKD
jgi:hypothetical protein